MKRRGRNKFSVFNRVNNLGRTLLFYPGSRPKLGRFSGKRSITSTAGSTINETDASPVIRVIRCTDCSVIRAILIQRVVKFLVFISECFYGLVIITVLVEDEG